ncbi:trp operon leader peptide [Streptomyces lasalocidi]
MNQDWWWTAHPAAH